MYRRTLMDWRQLVEMEVSEGGQLFSGCITICVFGSPVATSSVAKFRNFNRLLTIMTNQRLLCQQ